MDFLISLIGFLIVLTPVVFFHELGHFWAARRSGVTVEVFSVGFGPEILGLTDRHGTRWKFSALPLGGYVKMAGDEDAASTPSADAAATPGSFQSASVGARAFIVGMGPLANFILGVLLMAMVYVGYGKIVTPSVVSDVMADSAAAAAGIEPGDRIVSMNGHEVNDFSRLRSITFENPGVTMPITVDRGGRVIDLSITPDVIDDACLGARYGRLGVISEGRALKPLGPGEALYHASIDSFTMAIDMLRGIGRLASGNANKGEIGGPVKIAELSGQVVSQGIVSMVVFIAVISINLGLVNLLPIPALDGGHLMFFGLEKIMGRPLDHKTQEIIMRVGLSLLMTLIIFLTLFDVASIFTRDC
ncbi:MAG: RIP metalloprotease RseP [Candidatus Puniceispirillales bacterium]